MKKNIGKLADSLIMKILIAAVTFVSAGLLIASGISAPRMELSVLISPMSSNSLESLNADYKAGYVLGPYMKWDPRFRKYIIRIKNATGKAFYKKDPVSLVLKRTFPGVIFKLRYFTDTGGNVPLIMNPGEFIIHSSGSIFPASPMDLKFNPEKTEIVSGDQKLDIRLPALSRKEEIFVMVFLTTGLPPEVLLKKAGPLTLEYEVKVLGVRFKKRLSLHEFEYKVGSADTKVGIGIESDPSAVFLNNEIIMYK